MAPGRLARIKNAAESGRNVLFLDETGLMLQPPVRRTWAPRGERPVMYCRDRRDRLEDIVPSSAIVTCYHTASGYCAMCRRRVEGRAPERPPAANLPHG